MTIQLTRLALLFISFTSLRAQNFEVKELSKSSHAQGIQHVDLNNDGLIDILTYGEDLSYYLGLGNNEYSMKHVIFDFSRKPFVNNFKTNFQLVDLTGNGFLDIVYASSYSSTGGSTSDTHVLIMAKNDSLSFTLDTLANTGHASRTLYVVDVDQDGDMDVVTSHFGPVLLNNGDLTSNRHYYARFLNQANGTFSYGFQITSYWQVERISLLNKMFMPSSSSISGQNSFIQGLVVQPTVFPANYYQNWEYIYFENGQINSHNLQTINATNFINFGVPSNIFDIAEIDVNDDGLLDLVVPHEFPSTGIQYYLKTSNGYSNMMNDTVSFRLNAENIMGADVDGDGKKDLIWAASNALHWYKLMSPGNFVYQGILFNNLRCGTVNYLEYIDVDNDGDLDIVAAGNRGLWHIFNDGAYNFQSHKIVLRLPNLGVFPSVVDLDGDGKNDLLYGTTSEPAGYPDVTWQKNLGNNIFSEDIGLDRVNVFRKLGPFAADMNNDGAMDLVYFGNVRINNVWQNDRIVIYYNDGQGSFGSPQVAINRLVESMLIKDIDGDGNLDFAYIFKTSTSSSQRQVAFLKNNNAAASFTEFIAYGSFNTLTQIAAEDYDCDGGIDIIIKENNLMRFFKNVGGSFSSANSLTMPYNATRYALADFDNDGFNDLLFVSSNSSNAWNAHYYLLKNNGIGNFTDTFLVASFPAQNPPLNGRIIVTDFDNDGDLDFLANELSVQQPSSQNYPGQSFFYFKNDLQNGAFHWTEIDYDLSGTQHYTVGNINESPTPEIIQLGGRGTWLRTGISVNVGATPQIVADTLFVCAGETFSLEVLNFVELNDNITWGLFENTCSGTPIQTAENGVFVLSTFVNQSYYIAAINGISFQGTCMEVFVVVQGTQSPTLSIGNVSELSATIQVSSSIEPQNHWLWSIDNGLNWQNTTGVVNEIQLSNLNPNSCYNILVQNDLATICPNNPSSALNFCTDCIIHEIWDTVPVCYNIPHIFPDGFSTGPIESNYSRSYTMPNEHGCDSLIHQILIPNALQNEFLHTTICKHSNFTMDNGQVIQNITNPNLNVSHPIYNGNGCYSGLKSYSFTLLTTVAVHDTVEVCYGSDWVSPNNITYSNIQSPVSHKYTVVNNVTCDSTFYVFVTFSPNSIPQGVTYSICQGQSIDFYGTSYNQSGVYNHIIENPDECDMLHTLNLTVLDIEQEIFFTDSICHGGTFDFFGEVLTEPGNYTHYTVNPMTCTVNHLNLSVIDCDNSSLNTDNWFDIEAFPNPATEAVSFLIHETLKIKAIRVYIMEGKLIQEVYESNSIDVRNLQSGMYFALIGIADVQTFVKFSVCR